LHMRTDQLSATLQEPDVHRQLLGDYKGPYSLGIGRDPENPAAPAIILHVQDDPPLRPPPYIQIGPERVRVITRRGFVAPKPL